MSADAFPAFIRAEYDPSGSGFPAFERAAEQASSSVRQRFEADFATIKQTVANALSIPRNAGGSLDLGVDQQRDAARALQAQATAAREVAAAMRQAAAAAGDNSSQARASLAAAEALEVEYRQEAQAALAHAEALEQVQVQLNRTKSATDAVVISAGRGTTAFGAVTNSARSLRFAGLQASQQVQDMVVQFQAGTRGSLIMAQQLPQLAFALSGVEGKAGSLAARIGALGRFLAGGWGTAIFVGVAAIGALTSALRDNAAASDLAKTGTDGLSDAQSALGRIFDLSNGKIKSQNELLRLNARLTAINLRADALKERQNAIDVSRSAQSVGAVNTFEGLLERGLIHGGLEGTREGERNRSNISNIIDSVHNGSMSKELALRLSETQDFTGLNVTRSQFQQAIIDAASSVVKTKLADKIDKSLDTGVLDSAFLKPNKARTKATPDLTRMSESAEEAIARINARWSEQPTLIKRAQVDTLKLDNIIADLARRKPPGWKKYIAQAKEAKAAVIDGLERPYNEFVERQQQSLAIQRLADHGRTVEAEALQDILALQRQMGPLSDYQKRNILAMAAARKQEADAAELERQRQQAFLGALQQTQQVIAQSIATLRTGGASGFLKTLFGGAGSSLDQLIGNYVTAKVFGPTFQALEQQVRGETPIDRANAAVAAKVDNFGSLVSRMTTSASDVPGVTDRVVRSLGRFVDALDSTSAQIARSAANDNIQRGIGFNGITSRDLINLPIGSDGRLGEPDITVIGKRIADELQDPFAFSGQTLAKTLQTALGSVGLKISDQSVKALGGMFGTAIEGLYAGQVAGGLILGSHGDRTGEALGGALGGALGKSLEAGATKLLGKTLGSLAGPIGGALGGVLGGLVGGLFHSSKQGGAVLTGSGSGAIFGNSTAYKQQASSLSQSVQSGLQNIVDQLGGTLGSYLVSIGTYNGSYRVNPSGGTKLGGGHGKLGNVIFGDDEQAAVQYAILDAIKDGAVRGIDQGAQRLLAAGNDLTVQLQKALSFEQVFKDLKAHTDPVGAAIDEVDAKFTKLKAIFAEAGASAQQYADLQKEYDYERSEAIKQATQQSLGSLKDLLSQLTTGDNGRSLRDRIAAARAAYDPLAAQIKAGDTSNADQFSSAAQTLLGLTQQLNGSQTGYFTLLDQVTALTQNAVTAQQKLIDNATNGSTPFADAQGTSAVTGSINDMNSSLSAQLAAVNKNLGTTIAQNDNIIQALSQRGALGRSNF